MKIYFIRHGEAIDDVEDRYGGWADFPLSSRGVEQARETGQKLKSRGVTAEAILTSPFKRAHQTAEEIGKILGLPVETSVYLKERNTYGLLCGERKDEAKEKYPDLVSAYENDEPVAGYEPYEAFLERVKKLVELLPSLGYETLICATHGKLLKAFLNDVVGGREVEELGDGCIVAVELTEDGGLKILNTEGVTFK